MNVKHFLALDYGTQSVRAKKVKICLASSVEEIIVARNIPQAM